MWPDRVSNPGPLALESDMLLTVLHSPAIPENWVPIVTGHTCMFKEKAISY